MTIRLTLYLWVEDIDINLVNQWPCMDCGELNIDLQPEWIPPGCHAFLLPHCMGRVLFAFDFFLLVVGFTSDQPLLWESQLCFCSYGSGEPLLLSTPCDQDFLGSSFKLVPPTCPIQVFLFAIIRKLHKGAVSSGLFPKRRCPHGQRLEAEVFI